MNSLKPKWHFTTEEREIDRRPIKCKIAFNMARAEPDVGIMTDYVDDWDLLHPETEESLNIILTDEEVDDITALCEEFAAEESHRVDEDRIAADWDQRYDKESF
jgi:hypothetical protein